MAYSVSCSCPIEHISELLDNIFQSLVSSLPSFLKDANYAVTIFESVIFTPGSAHHIFTLDVTSLYTSILHCNGLLALRFFLEQDPHPVVNTDIVICLAELVLTLNSFEFNGQLFDQISGVAMLTKIGPSYTCLFMGHLEYLIWLQYTGRVPEQYHKYIDDGIGVTDMLYLT